jgi:hypothetical protein
MTGKSNEERELAELTSIFHECFGELPPGEKRGVFGIEAQAEERARALKRQLITEELASYGRGYRPGPGEPGRCA